MKTALADENKIWLNLYGQEVDFYSEVWILNNETPAAHRKMSTIDWRVDLGSGRTLTDAEFRSLLSEFKWFVESRITSPHEGPSSAATTAGHFGYAIKVIAQWMVGARLNSLSEIDRNASWDFVDHVAGRCDEGEEIPDSLDFDALDDAGNISGSSVRYSTAIRSLNTLSRIYDQRDAMKERGVACIPVAPFDGKSPHFVVNHEIGLHRDGRLKPIPDDAAIPILNSAARLIGRPADDVIQLSRLHDPLRTEIIMSGDRIEAYAKYNAAIREFQFATLDGESRAWQDSIVGMDRLMIDGRKVHIKESQRVRRLVLTIVEACVITIQGLTGVRAHELIGAKVSDRESTWPSTVTVEESKDHTCQLFYFNSETFKGRRRKTRWIIGSRLLGADHIPLVVRAFEVLEELLRPWRELGQTNDLLVTFVPSQGLPRKKKSIGKMTSGALSQLMKEFVHERVDLSKASPATRQEFVVENALRPHRWRTTFAIFLFRVSPSLLAGISDHFKHMNVAVTEDGYIGNDPSLIEECSSSRVQTAAAFLLEVTAPGARIAGGGSHIIEENSARIRELIGVEEGHSLQEKAVSFVDRWQLYVYNAAYAHCLVAFNPAASRCNKLAGSAGWRRPFPNDALRSVGVCMGCELLVVTPAHAAHFVDRAERNEKIAEQASDPEAIGIRKIAAARAKQSRLILRKLEEGGNSACNEVGMSSGAAP